MKKINYTILVALSIFISSCKKTTLPNTATTNQTTTIENTSALARTGDNLDIAKRTPRILFLGNSYTGAWTENLYDLFKNLADTNHNPCIIDKSAIVGYSLIQVANAQPAANYLVTNSYDVAFLQENSDNSLQNGGANYLSAVQTIAAKLKAKNPKVKIILYQLADPAANQPHQSVIDANNVMVKNTLNASSYSVAIVPIGDAIKASYNGAYGYNSQIWGAGQDALRIITNQYHFRPDAGFLAAVEMYASIFGKNVNTIKIPAAMQFYHSTTFTSIGVVQDVDALKKNAYDYVAQF